MEAAESFAAFISSSPAKKFKDTRVPNTNGMAGPMASSGGRAGQKIP
jgi:hypothetical protein